MMATKDKPIVIIGTGLAGYSLAKELRKIDTQVPLILITQDDGHFYSKPQLSTALQQAKTPKSLVVTNKSDMQAQLNAEILVFSTVETINAATQTIIVQTSDTQHEISYQSLILAMGAIPRPFPLLEKIQHHYRINNLLDYTAFIKNRDPLADITIIGSGLVGCEFANDFAQNTQQINMITPDPHPLYRLVPSEIGEHLQAALAAKGITWYTKAYLQEAAQGNEQVCLRLNDGNKISSSAVLTAIGLQPNITLAQKAGLEVNQGIIVDKHLQTSDPYIFALGDCAEIEGQCRQYVAPILQSARALAQTLCGKPTAVVFPIMPISLKVSSYPVIVQPPKTQAGQWIIDCYESGIKALFRDISGNLQGYALSGSQIEHRMECLKEMSPSRVIG